MVTNKPLAGLSIAITRPVKQATQLTKLIEEAGGKVSDFSGKNNYLFGKEIIGSNPYIFEQFLKIVQKYF